jgi:hypothetical protein
MPLLCSPVSPQTWDPPALASQVVGLYKGISYHARQNLAFLVPKLVISLTGFGSLGRTTIFTQGAQASRELALYQFH